MVVKANMVIKHNINNRLDEDCFINTEMGGFIR